jgi:hypothetical protein
MPLLLLLLLMLLLELLTDEQLLLLLPVTLMLKRLLVCNFDLAINRSFKESVLQSKDDSHWGQRAFMLLLILDPKYIELDSKYIELDPCLSPTTMSLPMLPNPMNFVESISVKVAIG